MSLLNMGMKTDSIFLKTSKIFLLISWQITWLLNVLDGSLQAQMKNSTYPPKTSWKSQKCKKDTRSNTLSASMSQNLSPLSSNLPKEVLTRSWNQSWSLTNARLSTETRSSETPRTRWWPPENQPMLEKWSLPSSWRAIPPRYSTPNSSSSNLVTEPQLPTSSIFWEFTTSLLWTVPKNQELQNVRDIFRNIKEMIDSIDMLTSISCSIWAKTLIRKLFILLQGVLEMKSQ